MTIRIGKSAEFAAVAGRCDHGRCGRNAEVSDASIGGTMNDVLERNKRTAQAFCDLMTT